MLHQSSMLVASEASSVNKSSAVAENKVNAPNTVDVKANAQQQMITNNGIISGVTGTSTAEGSLLYYMFCSSLCLMFVTFSIFTHYSVLKTTFCERVVLVFTEAICPIFPLFLISTLFLAYATLRKLAA